MFSITSKKIFFEVIQEATTLKKMKKLGKILKEGFKHKKNQFSFFFTKTNQIQ